MTSSYAQLSTLLGQYMSDTAARLVLRGVLESLNLSAETVGPGELPALASALVPASRHFVSPRHRDALLARLGSIARASDGSLQPLSVSVNTEADASRARLAAKQYCESLMASSFDAQKVATGVSELARNQISYAGGGTVELIPVREPRKLIRVVATDSGPGIPNLDDILGGRYRSRTGLGLGLLGVKRMADRFDVSSRPGQTRVEFEMWL